MSIPQFRYCFRFHLRPLHHQCQGTSAFGSLTIVPSASSAGISSSRLSVITLHTEPIWSLRFQDLSDERLE